jgi:hypothetical protein
MTERRLLRREDLYSKTAYERQRPELRRAIRRDPV